MVKGKIAVVGDAPLATGFRFAGVSDVFSTKDEDITKTLEMVVDNKDYGIVIVNERQLGNIEWRLKKKLDNLAYPVIVPVPDIKVKSAEEESIRYLIKRALGFDLGRNKK